MIVSGKITPDTISLDSSQIYTNKGDLDAKTGHKGPGYSVHHIANRDGIPLDYHVTPANEADISGARFMLLNILRYFYYLVKTVWKFLADAAYDAAWLYRIIKILRGSAFIPINTRDNKKSWRDLYKQREKWYDGLDLEEKKRSDPRFYTDIARGSPEWKENYKIRNVVERGFYWIKHLLNIDKKRKIRTKNIKNVEARIGTAYLAIVISVFIALK